jgi:hypothetical protein
VVAETSHKGTRRRGNVVENRPARITLKLQRSDMNNRMHLRAQDDDDLESTKRMHLPR